MLLVLVWLMLLHVQDQDCRLIRLLWAIQRYAQQTAACEWTCNTLGLFNMNMQKHTYPSIIAARRQLPALP